MWQAFRVIVTEESAGFSVTMAVLVLEALFLGIDTEKMAYFCGTIRDAQQNYVFDIPIAIIIVSPTTPPHPYSPST